MHPNSTGTEAPVLRTLPDLALLTSSPGCSPVASITSFNKPVNVSKRFPESRKPPSRTNQTQAGDGGTLPSRARGSEAQGVLGLRMWHPEGGRSCLGVSLSPGGHLAGVAKRLSAVPPPHLCWRCCERVPRRESKETEPVWVPLPT